MENSTLAWIDLLKRWFPLTLGEAQVKLWKTNKVKAYETVVIFEHRRYSPSIKARAVWPC